MNRADTITYFGETDFRNRKTRFGIKNSDRSRHVYIIGKTGMGKSTLLENMAAQDIMNGEGMCFVDPHGSAIDVLLNYVPQHRVEDVVYFAPFDTDFPISFNVLEDVDPDQRHLVMAGLIASFKKIWPDSFSARMEYILANTLLALLEYPGSTLLGVNRMLAEKDYRDDVIKHVTDSSVKSFWIDEYGKWDPRYAREAGAAIQNKIGQFTSNPLIRNIIGQEKTSFDLRKIMDERKILLVNLSKGRIGESNANLLGGMLITKLYLSAMSRADVGAVNLKNLPDFFFFVDEFQNFANESFADILAEARKYKLCLTVAHQYVDQMQPEVASAIFGNVGTMISFRIGPNDAEVFEKQFAPTFSAEDIVNLGKFKIYLSLMIDGIGSRPFSASTIAPLPEEENPYTQMVVASSRSKYAKERLIVEKDIAAWYEPLKKNVVKKSFNKELKSASEKKNIHKINLEDLGKKNKRDVDSPEKQKLKQEDEKLAEEEMRKAISPKLSTLLDGISFTEQKQKIIKKGQKQILADSAETKKKERPKQASSNNVKAKKASDRGLTEDSRSDLKKMLDLAMRSNGDVKRGRDSQLVLEKISNSIKEKKNPLEEKRAVKKDFKKKDDSNISPVKKTAGVPDDLLKSILS